LESILCFVRPRPNDRGASVALTLRGVAHTRRPAVG